MGGAAGIPLSEILTYFDWRGIVGEDAEDWLYLLRAMDSTYLDHVNKASDERQS